MATSAALVGFIGLGNMGWPMAANLARSGRFLVVHDLDAGRVRGFAEGFGGAVAGGANSFADVGIVVTMLPTGTAVWQALIDGGIGGALPRGAVVIDASSSDPAGTRRLGSELAALGVDLWTRRCRAGGLGRSTPRSRRCWAPTTRMRRSGPS